MPTYDYQCDACEHTFEVFQSMTEAAKRKCPECGKLKLRRLIGTGAGVIFRGSGFYQTDYRSSSYEEGAKKDAEAGGKKKKEEKEGGPKDSGGGTAGPKACSGPCSTAG